MSVDYHHRLIVSGPEPDVRTFQRRMHYEYRRTVGGDSWTEIVPFSFTSLYVLAPDARTVEPEQPGDPVELSVWPLKRTDARTAEVRYRFETRNLEMAPLLRVLARALPALTFRLTTLCLDDGSIESHLMTGRRTSMWLLPDDRRDVHWERARRKFHLAGADVDDNEEAHRWAEEEMLAEAMSLWDHTGKVRRNRPTRRYQWWNQITFRELELERQVQLAEFLEREEAREEAQSKKQSGRRPKGRSEGRAGRTRQRASRKR